MIGSFMIHVSSLSAPTPVAASLDSFDLRTLLSPDYPQTDWRIRLYAASAAGVSRHRRTGCWPHRAGPRLDAGGARFRPQERRSTRAADPLLGRDQPIERGGLC